MKNILTLIAILFITAPAYAQETINVNVKQEKTILQQTVENMNAATTAAAAAKTAAAAAAAVMKPPSSNVITPLEVDLFEYTHIAMVDVYLSYRNWNRTKWSYKAVENVLLSSPLSILNPRSDKRKFKKNAMYLRNEKNPNWIYFYYKSVSSNGIDSNKTMILRDSKNKILYKAEHLNVSTSEVLKILTGF